MTTIDTCPSCETPLRPTQTECSRCGLPRTSFDEYREIEKTTLLFIANNCDKEMRALGRIIMRPVERALDVYIDYLTRRNQKGQR